MDYVQRKLGSLHENRWFGLVVVGLLLIILLVIYLAGREGMGNNALGTHKNASNHWNSSGRNAEQYHASQGGPGGASYQAVNDHSGSSGDWCCYDSANHAEEELALQNPDLYLDQYAPEAFLGGSGAGGPRFNERGMATTMGLVAPLYQQLRAGGANFGASNLNETMINSAGREGNQMDKNLGEYPGQSQEDVMYLAVHH